MTCSNHLALSIVVMLATSIFVLGAPGSAKAELTAKFRKVTEVVVEDEPNAVQAVIFGKTDAVDDEGKPITEVRVRAGLDDENQVIVVKRCLSMARRVLSRPNLTFSVTCGVPVFFPDYLECGISIDGQVFPEISCSLKR